MREGAIGCKTLRVFDLLGLEPLVVGLALVAHGPDDPLDSLYRSRWISLVRMCPSDSSRANNLHTNGVSVRAR